MTETDLTLPDGRTLHVYDTDPGGDGLVVFWHHGTPNLGPPPEPLVEVVLDHFADLAATLERGMWIEFEGEGGQLAFAKLAWVSPLRGTYLFTNRQGQKAVSLTADELADRFRNDRARLVEAEPLVDRAFVSMMASLEERFGEQPA